jgi:hypothetical protein
LINTKSIFKVFEINPENISDISILRETVFQNKIISNSMIDNKYFISVFEETN